MSPELENMIEKNFPTVLNNFKKITKWIVAGDTPENPFKGALKEANDKFQALLISSDEQAQTITKLGADNAELTKQIAALAKSVGAIESSYDELDDRINNLDAPAALADVAEPKPKAEAKPKVKAEPKPKAEAKPTELEATAAAIGAGELSASAVSQVDDLLDAL